MEKSNPAAYPQTEAELRVQLAAIRQGVEASLANLPTPSPSAA